MSLRRLFKRLGRVLAPEGRAATPTPRPAPGLRVLLSEADGRGARVEPLPRPATRPLSEAEVEALISRLPPLHEEATEKREFVARGPTVSAPTTGSTAIEAFPACSPSQAEPPEADVGPLEVVRHAPEGDVPLASQLFITFSHAMVPLTSQDEAAEMHPVRLTPQPPGRWRWMGTKTLVFDPDDRFPMATRYQVEVPAGTRSPVGGTLAGGVAWTFNTPPATLEASAPNGTSDLNPVVFLSFNQRIDSQAVLRKVRVEARNQGILPVRPATDQEVAADRAASELARASPPGRWLALKLRAPLPRNTSVTVTVGPGTPSAEGPSTTTEAQSFQFRTFGDLAVFAYGPKNGCRPTQPWRISFTNDLDAGSLDPRQVRVSPPLPGMKVSGERHRMTIQGLTRGRTTYTVTLDPSIRDVFGQALGQEVTVQFEVGPARPALLSVGGPMVVAHPARKPVWSVFTVNLPALRVRLYRVTPENWPIWADSLRNSWRGAPPLPSGQMIFDSPVDVKASPEEFAETPIDLSPALTNGMGHVVVLVEPATAEGTLHGQVAAWVQVTSLGLTALSDAESLVAFVTELEDGRPVEGARVSFQSGEAADTDRQGVARISLPAESSEMLLASREGDVAILPAGCEGWSRTPLKDSLIWYVFDDRRIYRPGETARVKGWIRRMGAGPGGDVGGLRGAVEEVRWSAQDSRRHEFAGGMVPVGPHGGFDFPVNVPDTVNLGRVRVALVARGPGGLHGGVEWHEFQVEEFRRPEFEVSVTADEGPHFLGGSASATVSACYYAGGALPQAEVRWLVEAVPGHFRPPGWAGFTFGAWAPWWDWAYHESAEVRTTESLAGKTDPTGKHVLSLDFLSLHPARPYAVSASAAVTDVNRQTWSDTASLLVHPGSHYVGLKSERTFVNAGQPLQLQLIVTDLDGQPQAGRSVKVRSARLDHEFRNGRWVSTERQVREQSVTSDRQAVTATVTPSGGGTYRITATVEDPRGRASQSEITRWVAGGWVPRSDRLEQDHVVLIPDRQEYRPGETAEVLVQSPFAPAEGVLTLQRSGLVCTERFLMSGPGHTLKIPIQDGFLPNLHVRVDLVGQSDGEGGTGSRPAFAVGCVDLPIPPLGRRLKLEMKPRESRLEPRGSTVLDVRLQDDSGSPVAGGEVAIVVADEAVLALTGYDLVDPLRVFYRHRAPGVRSAHLRGYVHLQRGLSPGEAESSQTPAEPHCMPAHSNPEAPIQTRTDFKPLALFEAGLATDREGRAQVTLTLPDSLTRYRIMAVAVTERCFGVAESTVTARQSLMLRPSPPRFLNCGDHFELPIVVQNGTDQDLDVSLAVRTANLVLVGCQGLEVTVPSKDRVEVRFPAFAQEAGRAAFQVGAVAGSHADAAEGSMPVWTPATAEAFATYGVLDSGAMVQPIQAPEDVFPQFGGLEVTTSSTALQSLTDALLYLVSYPFECTEQISSRILAVVALKNVLFALKAEGLPEPEEVLAAVEKDVARLRARQRPDGSFGLWHRDDGLDWPFVSVHGAHALMGAHVRGFGVPGEGLELSRQYLRSIDQHVPYPFTVQAWHAIVAYALSVRHRLGDPDPARAARLIQEAKGPDKLSLEAVGWILPTLSGSPEGQTLQGLLRSRVTETAGTAHFVTAHSDDDDWLLLASDRRTDGILLEALIQDEPASDLIPKIARGLLSHRTRGRWGNTQENVFILLALDRYFQTYEKTTPNFAARAWIGQQFAGEQDFRGRSVESREIKVPMSWLAREPRQNLVLSKDGPGRLYYRLGMRYAPRNLNLAPADHGFTVGRSYEPIDGPSEVSRDADGTWRIEAGARVRVRVTVVAPTRRYHVALVDPLPAGLEPLNPGLAVTERLPEEDERSLFLGTNRPGLRRRRPRQGPWYEHQNLRDERAEAFVTLLWEGVHEYTYVARATTPGRFVVPPPRAEEMYHPETFGRGATAIVVVE